jgi:hypothetical protein
MDRKMLRDDQWACIEQLLPGKTSDPGCTAKDNRLFGEASSEFCVLAAHGVTCPESLENGTAHTCALPVGVTAAFGSGWPTCWVAMLTWNTCSDLTGFIGPIRSRESWPRWWN